MQQRGRQLGGLGTRIGLRTFVLFCLCAMLPTALFALIAYLEVSKELTSNARARLQEASKNYGILVNERLVQIDTLLADYARMQLLERTPREQQPSLILPHVRILQVLNEASATASEVPSVVSHLEIVSLPGTTSVRMHVSVAGSGRRVAVIAEPTADYLWDTSAVQMLGTTLCIYAGAIQLHCTRDEDSIAAHDTASVSHGNSHPDQLVVAEWELFLKPRFGVEEWTVRAHQRDGAGQTAMRTFSATLPAAAGLAIVGAMLLSSVQIRRSHRPLELLTQAADSMRRGKLDVRVQLSGRDEYSGLGRAFNRMASHLNRQLRLLGTLSQIDQLILTHPEIGTVAERALPGILRVLGCDTVAVLLWDRDSESAHRYAVHRREAGNVETTRILLSRDVIDRLSRSRPAKRLPAAEVSACQLQTLDGTTAMLWHAVPVEVDQKSRGALLLGFAGTRRSRRKTFRYASELAHRFAVALGNDDRDRALIQQAYYDSLTELPNRQLFKDRLAQELARARRAGSSVALFFIDLDRFKNINDSLGHSAGDELLKIVARRLRSVVRDSETLARLGGDEFTVICSGIGANLAAALAHRILEAFSAAVPVQGMQCVVQASVGIAIYPQDGADGETLVRNADTAMYRAKSTGRGKAVFFEETMNAHAVRRLRLEQRLRQALDRNQLTLYFQPKVHAARGGLAGVEALARWFDAEEGAVAPVEFIAISEDSGLIGKLGAWALHAACETLSEWRSNGFDVPHVAVNVSMHQLRDPDFAALIETTLRRFGLSPDSLELELTESTLAENPMEIAGHLQRVRALGVRIAIDDFGTGYSSMAVLAQMPVEILKIDRAFVTDCASHREAGALLHALVGVAQALGKQVVAEGVETVSQAVFLRSQGCEFMQGYLFGRPMPAEELERQFSTAWSASRAVATLGL